jgi:hypothetical protein
MEDERTMVLLFNVDAATSKFVNKSKNFRSRNQLTREAAIVALCEPRADYLGLSHRLKPFSQRILDN